MNMNTINKVASGLGDANRPPIAPPSAPATPATATAGAKMKLEDEEQLQQPASISLQLDGVVAGKNGDNSSSSTTSNMLLATNTACGMTDMKSDAAAAATTNNNNNINTGAGDADAGGKSGSRQQHQFTLERTQAIHDNDDSASQPRRQQLCDRQVKHERDASRQDLSLSQQQQQQQQQQRQANQATSKTPQAADNGTANGAGSFRGRGSGNNSDRASQPTRNDSSDPPSTRLNHLTTTCTANADQIGLANCSNSDCSAKNNGNVAPDNPVVGNVGSCNGQVGDRGNNISKQNSSNSGSSLISAQQQQPATATINQEVRYCKESSLKNPTSNTSNSSEAPENNKLNFKSSQTIEFETNNNNSTSSSNRRTIPVSSVNSVLVDSKQQQKATSKLLLAPHNDNTGSNTINSTRAIISNSNNLNNNNNNYSNNTNYYRHQEDLPYYQKLFFTRWPIYAVAICTMASLLFAIFSSVLSVYLTCGLQPTSAAYSPASSLSSRTSSEALIDALDVASSSSSSVTSLASNNFTRLPSSLWPIHYDLFFQPYIREPFDFDGKVSIRIKCTVATNNISLHTKDLELDRKSLKLTLVTQQQNDALNISKQHQQQQLPSIVDLTQDNQLQYSIIHLSDYLTAGREYIISIDFKGLLGDDLAGFYRIKYEDQKGKTTWIAATQFQATDARKAFPCFDEPLYKATFGITIKHWTNMTALSNMPLVSSDVDQTAGWVTDKFAVSHRMSTYLVAFAVTNFESKTLGNITVWARPGMINSADYALDIAGKILKHYEKFFGIDFPLPKMDMIALPDFNAGAMENWGLITYRETAMLYDEKISSVSNKQRVATVVAHELAHQWFGNLVTPKWWDDLWLNEGFASYVEYIGVDHVEPGWKMLDQFVVEENQDVLKADSLSTSHQISIPVNNPDEINEIFDRISYGKGASIIRMMNHFLTEDVLKAGLRNYLAALKYGNAEQSDLWYYLTQVQSEMNISQIVDVKKVMNSWTLQTGFPLVTLMRDYKKNSANLDQNRFQILSKERTATDLTSKWEIPITMTSAKELNWTPRTRLWMHQDDDGPVQVPTTLVPNANQWMLVNVDQVGYYRVNYDVKNWQLLIEQLVVDHTAINPINRAQILDDIFDLAKNNLIDYKFAMNATKYLKKETDFLAWDTILRSFVFIDDMLQRAPIYGEWKEYVSELLEEFYNKYKDQSWTIDGMNDTKSKNDVLAMYNRVNAISWACTVNQHCIKKARALFDEWKNTGVNNIDPSLRGILYCNVIENGDKSDWEFLWKKYEKEQKANERDRLLRSMACSKELWILSRYLEWTFDKTRPIRRQDGSFVFRAIARNNYGRDVAFNFLRERWQTIKDYYGKSSFSFSSLIKSVTSSLNTNFELQQLISFYKSIKNDVGTAKRSFLQSIEEVESNVAWMSNYYKTLEVWIRETRGKPHL